MAKDSTFDIVSDFDLSEMHNAIDQSKREIANRYDFKGTAAELTFDPKGHGSGSLVIMGDNDFHIESILDIVRKKLASRGISQKTLDTSLPETTANMVVRKEVYLRKGLDQEKAKQITNLIRQQFPKIKAQIQGDTVRVSSQSKDELQRLMQTLRDTSLEFPINFVNYR
ncbi:MAG TPA: YajQ family cyclic di-GMP-binding protein [Candidatus Saccharimonadales bacterium]|nr:YajQ family cyclic di-GMP-binding protein [Candidatus Saccharimonadales bacterium]